MSIASARTSLNRNLLKSMHGNVGGDPVFLNPNASEPDPANGRFGTARVGSLVGSGPANASLSAVKSVNLTEQAKLQVRISPQLRAAEHQLDSGSYGQSSALQTAESARNRAQRS